MIGYTVKHAYGAHARQAMDQGNGDLSMLLQLLGDQTDVSSKLAGSNITAEMLKEALLHSLGSKGEFFKKDVIEDAVTVTRQIFEQLEA